MKRVKTSGLALFFLVVIVIVIDLPSSVPINLDAGPLSLHTQINRPTISFNLGKFSFSRDLDIKQGLDLKGGTEVTLKADMTEIPQSERNAALQSAEAIVRRRVDLFGISEPLIQRSRVEDQYRLIVQLPGVNNVSQALALIGQTAQLDFRETVDNINPEATSSALSLDNFIPTGLTGKDLTRAQVQFNTSSSGGVGVLIEFTPEGTEKFAAITQKNIGKPVAIFLDEFPLSLPVVQQEITTGQAVISGNFSPDTAQELAIQLNAGALPTPIEIIQQRTVGASLGTNSVTQSLQAGLIGLAIVIIFMIAIYGRLGLIANLGLVLYGLITLAIYKLIPITITLPGLAGFLLSVGMAVDSNILIFERMKEEQRLGKPWQTALELGFGRAWDSIKDANLATLTTAFILFNPLNWEFLPRSGLVRGFALTLGLGVALSLFTGVVITRYLLRHLYKGPKT